MSDTTRKSLLKGRIRLVIQWRWQQFAVGFNFDAGFGEFVIGLGFLVIGVEW